MMHFLSIMNILTIVASWPIIAKKGHIESTYDKVKVFFKRHNSPFCFFLFQVVHDELNVESLAPKNTAQTSMMPLREEKGSYIDPVFY